MITKYLILLGFLIVVFISFSKTSSFTYENCQDESLNKLECMLSMVNRAIKNKDIEGGLKLLDFYKKDPDFTVNCHGYGHSLGKEAYKLFASGQKIKFTPLISICNWGFYHGFVETLFSQGGGRRQANRFCQEVDRELKSEAPGTLSACYHGIGHGVVNNHDLSLRGDVVAISNAAILACGQASLNASEENKCASGIFMGLAGFMAGKEYGLSINSQDPLWYCREQPYELQNTCFSQSYQVLRSLFKDDIKRAVSVIESTADTPFIKTAVREFVSSIIISTNSNESLAKAQEFVYPCKSLDKFTETCIIGIEGGLAQQENSQAPVFCEEDSLTPREKILCFKEYLKIYSELHSEKLLGEECRRVESVFSGACQDLQYLYKSL